MVVEINCWKPIARPGALVLDGGCWRGLTQVEAQRPGLQGAKGGEPPTAQAPSLGETSMSKPAHVQDLMICALEDGPLSARQLRLHAEANDDIVKPGSWGGAIRALIRKGSVVKVKIKGRQRYMLSLE